MPGRANPVSSMDSTARTIALLLAAAILPATTAGCKRDKAYEAPPVAVRLERIQTRTLRRPVVISAMTEAMARAMLSFQVAGKVSRISVDQGDEVKKGQLLAAIDKESTKLNVDLSRARYREAWAAYRKVKGGFRKEVVQQHRSAWRQARALHEKARLDYRSAKKLRRAKAISREKYERFRANYQSTKAAMTRAQQAYQLHFRGHQKEDVQMAGTRTSQARANLKLARKRLQDTELLAPFAGVIARKLVERGEMVSASRAAFELLDLRRLKILVGVPERVIDAVFIGQQAHVLLRQIPLEARRKLRAGKLGLTDLIRRRLVAPGRVERRGVVLDKATLTYQVEVVIDNPIVRREKKRPIRLTLPGKVVMVHLLRRKQQKGISLPISAVLNDGRSKFVYVRELRRTEKGRKPLALARKVPVDTGGIVGNRLVVTGLKDGAEVVVEGQHQLSKGRRLFVVGVRRQQFDVPFARAMGR